MNPDEALRAEVEDLAKQNLNESDAVAFMELHDELMAKKEALDQEVMQGAMSGEEFAAKINDLTAEYLQVVEERIGPDSFRRMFELEPGERLGVVDPEMAEVSLSTFRPIPQ